MPRNVRKLSTKCFPRFLFSNKRIHSSEIVAKQFYPPTPLVHNNNNKKSHCLSDIWRKGSWDNIHTDPSSVLKLTHENVSAD